MQNICRRPPPPFSGREGVGIKHLHYFLGVFFPGGLLGYAAEFGGDLCPPTTFQGVAC